MGSYGLKIVLCPTGESSALSTTVALPTTAVMLRKMLELLLENSLICGSSLIGRKTTVNMGNGGPALLRYPSPLPSDLLCSRDLKSMFGKGK